MDLAPFGILYLSACHVLLAGCCSWIMISIERRFFERNVFWCCLSNCVYGIRLRVVNIGRFDLFQNWEEIPPTWLTGAVSSTAMTSGALFLALRSHSPATNPPTVTSRKERLWRNMKKGSLTTSVPRKNTEKRPLNPLRSGRLAVST